MNYAVIENGKIVNMITARDDKTAALLGAVPILEGKWIGDTVGEPTYTADDMFKALLGTLASESGGGGGNIS